MGVTFSQVMRLVDRLLVLPGTDAIGVFRYQKEVQCAAEKGN